MKTSGIRSPARSEGAAITPRRRRGGNASSSALSDVSPRPRLRLSNIIDQFKERNKINTMSPSDSRLSVLSDNTDISEPRRKSWWRNLGDNSRDMQVVFDNQEKMDVSSTVEELVDIEVLRQEKQVSLHFSDTSDNESIASIVLPQRRLFSEKQNIQQNKFSDYVTKQYTKELLQDQNISKTNENDKTIEVTTTLPKKLFNYARKKQNKLVFPFELLDVSSKANMNKTKETAIENEKEPRNLFGNRAASTTKGRYLHADFFASESEDDISDVQNIVEENVNTKTKETSIIEEEREIGNTEGTKTKDRPLHADLFALESEDDISDLQNIVEENDNIKTKETSNIEEEREIGNTEGTKTKDRPLRADLFALESEDDISDLQNIVEENDNIKTNKTSNIEEERKSENLIGNTEDNKAKDRHLHANIIASESEDDITDVQNIVKENETTKSNKTSNVQEKRESPNFIGQTEGISWWRNLGDNSRDMQVVFDNQEKMDVSSTVEELVDIEVLRQEKQVSLHFSDTSDNESIASIVLPQKRLFSEKQNVQQNKFSDYVTKQYTKELVQDQNISKTNEKDKTIEVTTTLPKKQNKLVFPFELLDVSSKANMNKTKETAIENEREPRNLFGNRVGSTTKGMYLHADFFASESENDISDVRDIVEENVNAKTKETSNIEEERELENIECTKTKDRPLHADLFASESEDDISDLQNIVEENDIIKTNKTSNIEEERKSQNLIGNTEDTKAKDRHLHANASESEYDTIDVQNIVKENETTKSKKTSNVQEERESQNFVGNTEGTETKDIPLHAHLFASESEDDISDVQNIIEVTKTKKKISTIEEEKEPQELFENIVPTNINEQSSHGNFIASESEDDVSDGQNIIQENENTNIKETTTIEEEMEQIHSSFTNTESKKSNFIASGSEDDTSDVQNIIKENENTKNRKTMHDSILESPEAILHDTTNKNFISELSEGRRNTSIRKSKTIVRRISEIVPIQEPLLDSNGRLSEGTKNSSAEGSGWDSHRTTRKTMRQTFGKDFTPRKSLRTLVMEKAAKRKTAVNDQIEWEAPNANSTQMTPSASSPQSMVGENSPPAKKVQISLDDYLIRVQQKNLAMEQKAEEKVKNYMAARVKTVTNTEDPYQRKPASQPLNATKKVNVKPRLRKNFDILGPIPEDVLNDFSYKPPKRYQPPNASWVTKRLYSFLESKLELKYDYKARIRAEKLVEFLYKFSLSIKKEDTAPSQLLAELQREMARLNIVKSYFEFYNFFRDFMPKEIRMKVIPDIANMLPLPPGGVFVDIIPQERQG